MAPPSIGTSAMPTAPADPTERSMRSPLMWAHYAEKHCGVCLGFEIPEKPEDFDNSIIRPINYEPKRLKFELANLQESEENRLSFIRALLHTKAVDWAYEREYRTMADLDDQDPTTKYFYVDFSANMVLREVLIGCRSKLLPPQVAANLRGLPASVKIYKVRAGFERFEMVRDRKIPLVNVLATKR